MTACYYLNPKIQEELKPLILQNFVLFEESISLPSTTKNDQKIIGCLLSFDEIVENKVNLIKKLLETSNFIYAFHTITYVNAMNLSFVRQKPTIYHPLIEEIIKKSTDLIKSPYLLRIFLRVSQMKFFSSLFFMEVSQVFFF